MEATRSTARSTDHSAENADFAHHCAELALPVFAEQRKGTGEASATHYIHRSVFDPIEMRLGSYDQRVANDGRRCHAPIL